LRNEHKHNIIGAWTGKAFVAHQGIQKEWDAALTFNEDMTVSLSYDINGKQVILTGNYTANLMKHPALIDIHNFGFPKGKTFYCCLAIAEFPIINTMNISGIIGECGKVSRPAQFNRNPSNNHQLYLELTRKK